MPAPVREFLRENEGRLWAFAVAAAVLVVGVGLVVAPDVFWDRFLWEDIWGPTLTDARGTPPLCWNGGDVVPATRSPAGQRGWECADGGPPAFGGYTLTSEIAYGLVLAALLYTIYRHLLQRHRVDTGFGFILGLLPLILLGPFARVMEDAAVFNRSATEAGAFAPLFISPWIYFQIAVYALAFLGVAILLDRRDASRARRRAVVATVLGVEVLAYALFVGAFSDEFLAVAPWWSFLVGAALAYAFYLAGPDRTDGAPRFHGTVAALGIPLLAPTVHLMVRWTVAGPWAPHSRPLAPEAAGIILLFAVGVTFVAWWVARLVGTMRPHALVFATATAVALVLGHMIDGFATWIALKDPFHLGLGAYEEKHPVSDLFLSQFGGASLDAVPQWLASVLRPLGALLAPLGATPLDGILFPVVKLAMVFLVLHLLHREFPRADSGEGTLAGVIYMAVFVLGFAPGMRNLLLVTMGF